MENKFMTFWEKWGPTFLIGTGILQFAVFKDFGTGLLFFLLGGLILIEKNTK